MESMATTADRQAPNSSIDYRMKREDNKPKLTSSRDDEEN